MTIERIDKIDYLGGLIKRENVRELEYRHTESHIGGNKVYKLAKLEFFSQIPKSMHDFAKTNLIYIKALSQNEAVVSEGRLEAGINSRKNKTLVKEEINAENLVLRQRVYKDIVLPYPFGYLTRVPVGTMESRIIWRESLDE